MFVLLAFDCITSDKNLYKDDIASHLGLTLSTTSNFIQSIFIFNQTHLFITIKSTFQEDMEGPISF